MTRSYGMGKICTCHACKTDLTYNPADNIYSGGPWECGKCGADVTVDIYGKYIKGYYVVDSTKKPVFRQERSDAYKLAEETKADVYYYYDYHKNPELVKSFLPVMHIHV